jgi:hypothetical protein
MITAHPEEFNVPVVRSIPIEVYGAPPDRIAETKAITRDAVAVYRDPTLAAARLLEERIREHLHVPVNIEWCRTTTRDMLARIGGAR